MKSAASLLLGAAVASSSCTTAPDHEPSHSAGGSGTSGSGAGGDASAGTSAAGASGSGVAGTASGGVSAGGASAGTGGSGAAGTTSSGGSAGTSGMTSGGASGAGGATAGSAGAPAGGADSAGTSGTASGGMGGGGAAGATAGSAGAPAGGSGGITTCNVGGPADVELATSIPESFKQPSQQAGTMSSHAYPCYHYTDLTAGQSGDPNDFVLERRDQPITKEFNLYLPYQYSPDKTYPVVYILHGITDNEETWLERGDPHPARLLDNLIAAGEIQPILAVFPNGNSSSTFLNRDFSNQAGYYFFANELVNDLIPFVESEWSVAKDRKCRGVSGFSMGGMQTINAGLCQSLEHIAWFGALSAAPTTYGASQIAEYLGRENPNTYPLGYFYNVVGSSDGTARSSHEAAVQGLNSASEFISDENFVYHNVPGGHDYGVASIGLYNFLRISFAP